MLNFIKLKENELIRSKLSIGKLGGFETGKQQ